MFSEYKHDAQASEYRQTTRTHALARRACTIDKLNLGRALAVARVTSSVLSGRFRQCPTIGDKLGNARKPLRSSDLDGL